MTKRDFIISSLNPNNPFWTSLLEVEIQEVFKAMEQYAEYKCKEAIRNVRHQAVELVVCTRLQEIVGGTISLADLERDIMNIQNQEVLPNFD
jgi:hypothetical protein